MNTSKTYESQAIPMEEPLVGINAKTAPYPAARSWSGGRRRILGKGTMQEMTSGCNCLTNTLCDG